MTAIEHTHAPFEIKSLGARTLKVTMASRLSALVVNNLGAALKCRNDPPTDVIVEFPAGYDITPETSASLKGLELQLKAASRRMAFVVDEDQEKTMEGYLGPRSLILYRRFEDATRDFVKVRPATRQRKPNWRPAPMLAGAGITLLAVGLVWGVASLFSNLTEAREKQATLTTDYSVLAGELKSEIENSKKNLDAITGQKKAAEGNLAKVQHEMELAKEREAQLKQRLATESARATELADAQRVIVAQNTRIMAELQNTIDTSKSEMAQQLVDLEASQKAITQLKDRLAEGATTSDRLRKDLEAKKTALTEKTQEIEDQRALNTAQSTALERSRVAMNSADIRIAMQQKSIIEGGRYAENLYGLLARFHAQIKKSPAAKDPKLTKILDEVTEFIKASPPPPPESPAVAPEVPTSADTTSESSS